MFGAIRAACAVAALVVVGSAASAQGSGAQEASVVDALQRPSPITVGEGYVAYSSWSDSRARYELTLRAPDGSTPPTPVPPAPHPHDIDLGTDSDGAPALIVSLCDQAPVGGRSGGCDLFVHTLGSAALRAVNNANTALDESRPTISRGRIAFVRTYGPSRPVVYTKPLVAPRSRPSVRQPGVPGGRGDVRGLELRGRQLAQAMRSFTGSGDFGIVRVRLVDTRRRDGKTLARQEVGMAGRRYIGLSLDGRHLAWYLTCAGDTGGCRQVGGAVRHRLSDGRYEVARSTTQLSGFSWADGAFWRVRASMSGDCFNPELAEPGAAPPPDSGTCPVLRAPTATWRPVDRDRIVS